MNPGAVPDCVAALETGLADAVLPEIVAHLDALARDGTEVEIDLRSLPMSDGDRSALEQKLGQGEVSVTLDVAGESTVRETAFSGVWWVKHKDNEGRVVSEAIAITRIPDILPSHPEDIRQAAIRLSADIDRPADPMGTEQRPHV